LPDVSLYDHLKTTAAFSICLFDYLKEKGKSDIKIKSNEKPFLLIGGDISGIQKFIYDIISKNAAKNLKGRSFYLQLLSDSIIKKILFNLSLFRANIIYGSGGSFFILAPNTNKNLEILDKTKTEISESIFNTHGTSLFAAIDSVCFGEHAIFNGGIGELWHELHKKLDTKKQHRYSSKLKKDYDFFFKPSGFGKKQLRDAITGEEILPNEKTKDIEGKKIKYSTYKQIQLGKKLRDADYWIISKNKLTYWGNENEYNPANLGIYHYFLSKEDLDKKREELKKSADNVEIFIVNDLDFLESAISGKDNLYNYTFYGGNDFPAYKENQKDDNKTKHYEGEPISFDKLIGNGDLKRLGILRMDVDNLGQIFADGFLARNRTFSRLSALSRSLDYFFKGYLNTIWKTDKYKENTFILYSGGDDLFIVGKWDVLIEMAEEINTKFNDWTCKNPALSISGGITIVTGKFPILKSSEFASEAESLAKEYKNNRVEKNAFTLMGFPLNRNIEYPVVKKLKNKIKDCLNDDLPKAFISNIYNFYENRKMQIEKNQNESWQWQLAYNISRMIKRVKSKNSKDLLKQIKIDVFANTWEGEKHNFKYHSLEIVNIAARWAELEIRSN
jgi:CRISPR-associated protein Csm1